MQGFLHVHVRVPDLFPCHLLTLVHSDTHRFVHGFQASHGREKLCDYIDMIGFLALYLRHGGSRESRFPDLYLPLQGAFRECRMSRLALQNVDLRKNGGAGGRRRSCVDR